MIDWWVHGFSKTRRTVWAVTLFFVSMACDAQTEKNELLHRVDAVIAPTMRAWCESKMTYPPTCCLLRVYKREGVAEIWAKTDDIDALALLAEVPVCAVDRQPGPKLRQGDGKTPEGFYTGSLGFWSRYWWMWIDLEAPETSGSVGRGDAVKICLDYPNALDRLRSQACGIHRPGSAICLHGNCVTAGCVSFTNLDFLPIFACAMHHDSARFGPLQVHLFPFRFDHVPPTERQEIAETYFHADIWAASRLNAFWRNLEEGWSFFNEVRRPLDLTFTTTLKRGDHGPSVRTIRSFLVAQGFLDAPDSDVFDQRLQDAVKRFQTAQGLATDGIIGRHTMSRLQTLGCTASLGYGFR